MSSCCLKTFTASTEVSYGSHSIHVVSTYRNVPSSFSHTIDLPLPTNHCRTQSQQSSNDADDEYSSDNDTANTAEQHCEPIVVNKLDEVVLDGLTDVMDDIADPPTPRQEEKVLSAEELRRLQQQAFNLALIN
jgi:hypothetical protein